MAAHARSRFGFAGESFFEKTEQFTVVPGAHALQRLDCHRALQTGIECLHDGAEAALAEQSLGTISPEQDEILFGFTPVAAH